MVDTGLKRKRQFGSPNKENELAFRPLPEYEPSNFQSRDLDDDTRNRILNFDPLSSKPFAQNQQATNTIANHTAYLRDTLIWSSFPRTERAYIALKNLALCKPKSTYVDSLMTTTKPFVPGTEVNKLANQVIRINILETSQLELDRFVIHPFVKIHVVNLTTGKYLPKKDVKCVLRQNETLTTMDAQKTFVESGLDFIPPFATNCCDLRLEGIARAKWNYSIILNEEASWFYSPDTVLLFEILDYNKELIKLGSSRLDCNNYYRVAWGYLRLAGLAKNHIGLSKIQLYKYSFNPSQSTAGYIHKNYKRVPFVYFDFIWPDKTTYEGYLSVQVNGIPEPDRMKVTRNSKHIFEIEEDLRPFNVSIGFKKKNVSIFEDQDDPEFVKKRKLLLKRKRFEDEECRIPNDVLFRFQSAPLGCFRLSFSPNGRYLAAACTYKNSKTIIKIFNVEDGVLKYTLKGHKNLIHDLNWHASNHYLVSCSSDYTCKVWRIPEVELNEIDEEESEKQLFICTLFHPYYVYSSKFFIDRDTSVLHIATACFDSKVRLWKVELDNDKFIRSSLSKEDFLTVATYKTEDPSLNLLEHRHPNTLKFDTDGRLYVGDSLGTVHIWDVSIKHSNVYLQKVRELNHTEITGDPINALMLLPNERKKMLVHSRDNCIRTVDYSHHTNTRILGRFFGSKSSKFPIKSVLSPDGQYVLSGSEDGKIYLWDFTTSEPYNTEHLGTSFVGPVTDVDWNSNYHMFAVSGFGDQYPILVFTSDLNQEDELQKVLGKMKDYDDNSRRLDTETPLERNERRFYERGVEQQPGMQDNMKKKRTFES